MTRRQAVLRLGAAAVPALAAGRALGANDRIRVGVIGMGTRSGLLVDQLPEDAEVVAVADCFLERCEQARAKRGARWLIHQDYRQVLDAKDIDGVIVGTPDHARARITIHACQAGKDVYAEKPLTLYVAEGRAMVNAARRYNRVFQVGSQQRSMAMNRLACEFVRTGGLGKLYFVQGTNYTSSVEITDVPAEEPIPAGSNWDMWLNQAPQRPYSKALWSRWMRYRDYSGGEMTNWGAHGLDQIQCALGMSETGPVEFRPLEDSLPGALAFRYANGVTVRLELPPGDVQGGAIFVGEKGRLELIRNNFRTDPPRMVKELPPPEEVQKWRDDVALWQAKYHMQNWLDCMRSRARPVADVEIGHRSITVAHLANMARRLNRKLRWDPAAERFVDDREADALLTRTRRRGYELPAV